MVKQAIGVGVMAAALWACGPVPETPAAGGGGGSVSSPGGGGTGSSTGGGSSGGGGGTTSARTNELTAGTRLKVRTIVGEDGSRVQVGFFDTQRMENCTFVLTMDGKSRCAPLDATAYVTQYFSDAGCTQPLAYSLGPCATPPRTAFRAVSGCPTFYEFHTVAPISPAPTAVYLGSPATCTQTSAPSGMVFYRSTGLIPPSDFVLGNQVLE